MSSVITRVILCIVLFLVLTFLIGTWIGMHSLDVIPMTANPTHAEELKRVAVIDQFEVAYGPAIIAVTFFVLAVIALKPRLWTIVLAAGLAAFIFYAAPFPASAPGRSLTPGSFLSAGSFAVLDYYATQAANERKGERPANSAPATPSPVAPSLNAWSKSNAQQRAVKLYPDLATADSRLNQEFVRRYSQYQKRNPAYFHDPEWPTALAQECQAAIAAMPSFAGTWTGPIDPGTGDLPGGLVTFKMSLERKSISLEVRDPRTGQVPVTQQVDIRYNPVTDHTLTAGGFALTVPSGSSTGHFVFSIISVDRAGGTIGSRTLGAGTLTRVSSK